MDFFFTIVFIGIFGLIIWGIVKHFTSTKMTVNDEYFEQAGVRVDFKAGTIKINKYTYDVKKVTGISTVTESGGRGVAASIRELTGIVEISVDDFKKPVHRIPIGGGKVKDFNQRLYVAIRKAGGTDFY